MPRCPGALPAGAGPQVEEAGAVPGATSPPSARSAPRRLPEPAALPHRARTATEPGARRYRPGPAGAGGPEAAPPGRRPPSPAPPAGGSRRAAPRYLSKSRRIMKMQKASGKAR